MQKTLLATLALFSTVLLHATVWHVSTTGNDTHSGRRWADAFGTLEHALQIAVSGDEIWISSGRYEPAISTNGIYPSGGFHLKSGVTLRGGFFGDEKSPDERHRIDRDNNGVVEQWEFAGETILRLPTSAGGTVLDGSEEALVPTTLEGLTILAGNAYGAEESSDHPGLGGGAFLRGKYEVVSCEFTGNAAVRGGAVYLEGTGVISECLFTANNASAKGGAVFLAGEGGLICNCVFLENGDAETTRAGGAIASDDTAASEITLCTFVGNGATDAGSTLCLEGQVALRSSVVWDNLGHSQSVLAREKCVVENCATTAGGFPGSFAAGGILLAETNAGINGVEINDNRPGEYYPCFADITNNDFRLGTGSGLIKRGSLHGTIPLIDATGALRSETPSIGAYDSALPRNAAIAVNLVAPLYCGRSQGLGIDTDTPLAETRITLEEDGLLTWDGVSLTGIHAGTTHIRLDYTPEDPDAAEGTLEVEIVILPRPVKIVADAKTWNSNTEDFPELTWKMTAGELLTNDAITGELATYAYTTDSTTRGTESAETYAIVQGTLGIYPEEHSSDYEIQFRNGVLTVTTSTGGDTPDPNPEPEPTPQEGLVVGANPPTLSVDIVYGELLDGATQITGEVLDATTGNPVDGVFSWERDGEQLLCGIYELTWIFTPKDEELGTLSGTLPAPIQERPLYVCPYQLFKYYGDPLPELQYVLTNFAPGEDASIMTSQPVLSVDADASSPVGTYPIQVTGGGAPNYVITPKDATLTIAPRNLEIHLEDATKDRNTEDPDFTWTLVAGTALEGDEVPVSISRQPGEAVGEYPLLATSTDPNYAVIANDAVLTICGTVPQVYEITAEPLQPGQCLQDMEISYSFLDTTQKQFVPGTLVFDESYDINTPLTLLPWFVNCQFIPDDTENYVPVETSFRASFNHQPLKIQIDDKTIAYGDPLPEFTYTILEGEVFQGTTLVTNLQLKYASDLTPTDLPPGTYTIYNGKADYNSARYDYCYWGTKFQEGTLTVTEKQVFLIVEDKEYQYGEEIPQFTCYFSNTEDGSAPLEEDLFSSFTYEYQTSEPDDSGVSWISVNGTLANKAYKFTVVPGKLTRNPKLLTPVWPDLHKQYGWENPVVTVSAMPEELPEGTTSLTATCQIEFFPDELNRWRTVQGEVVSYAELPGRHCVRLASSDTGDARFQWDTSVTGTLVIGAEEILVNTLAKNTSFYGTKIGVTLTDYQGEARQRDFTYGVDILADLDTALLNVFEGGNIWFEGNWNVGSRNDTIHPDFSCTIRKNYTKSGNVVINPCIATYNVNGQFSLEGITLNRNVIGFTQFEARDCTLTALGAGDCTRLSLIDCTLRHPEEYDNDPTSNAIELAYTLPITSTEFNFQNVTFNWVKNEDFHFNICLTVSNYDSSAEAREYLTNWPVDLTTCTFLGEDEDLPDVLPTHFFPEAVIDDKTYFLLP